MPRSRSRERRRSRDRRSRSREHKRRHRSRDRSSSRDRHHKRYETSRYDRRDRDRSSERYQSSKHRDRSRSRRRDRSRDRRRDRSSSLSKNRRSSSELKQESVPKVLKPPATLSVHEASASTETVFDPRATFEIANEFSREGFEQFSRDHGIDFDQIETEEDRVAVHEKMEDLLKAHFAAQGKVYPPPKVEKPAINAATGFANDGSFMEQFKRMQDEFKQQQEEEKKRKIAEERLKSLPIRRRGGGKILKTGIVAKTKVNEDGSEGAPADAWSSYLKEVQKYKNSSCDSDSKTRPLVK